MEEGRPAVEANYGRKDDATVVGDVGEVPDLL